MRARNGVIHALGWYGIPMLQALGRHLSSVHQTFLVHELSTWCCTDRYTVPITQVLQGLEWLRNGGFVQSVGLFVRSPASAWRLTAAGMHLCATAAKASPGAPGPDERVLATRLWNLLRIRKRLTSDEAASTLVDAGADFAAQKKRIGTILAAWARHAPDVVTVGARLEAGHRRYVLLQDVGRWPPPERAGQMHPSMFASELAVPARFVLPTAPHSMAERVDE